MVRQLDTESRCCCSDRLAGRQCISQLQPAPAPAGTEQLRPYPRPYAAPISVKVGRSNEQRHAWSLTFQPLAVVCAAVAQVLRMLSVHLFVPGLLRGEPEHGVRQRHRGKVDFRTLQGVEQVAFCLTRSPSHRVRTKRKLTVAFQPRRGALVTVVGVFAPSPVGAIDHDTNARLLQRPSSGKPTVVDRKKAWSIQRSEGCSELAIGVVVGGRRAKHDIEPVGASVAHGGLTGSVRRLAVASAKTLGPPATSGRSRSQISRRRRAPWTPRLAAVMR